MRIREEAGFGDLGQDIGPIIAAVVDAGLKTATAYYQARQKAKAEKEAKKAAAQEAAARAAEAAQASMAMFTPRGPKQEGTRNGKREVGPPAWVLPATVASGALLVGMILFLLLRKD